MGDRLHTILYRFRNTLPIDLKEKLGAERDIKNIMRDKFLSPTNLLFPGTALMILLFSCQTATKKEHPSIFRKDNLVAWCIVPYDSLKRNPEERAQMLDRLGISRFAYDWRTEHLPSMAAEIETMNRHGIELESVWFWLDGGRDLLDENNELILRTLREQNVQTDLWVSFNNRFFEDLSDEERLAKAVAALTQVHARARDIGCRIALYNHGEWFGIPLNQIRIIEALGFDDIGIVYNLHHSHDQMDEFPLFLEKMKPYLQTVNLNGMEEGGPKILPIGSGDREFDMIRRLKESGFAGTVGILGHVEDADVETILRGNLDGLKALLASLGDDEALQTY